MLESSSFFSRSKRQYYLEIISTIPASLDEIRLHWDGYLNSIHPLL